MLGGVVGVQITAWNEGEVVMFCDEGLRMKGGGFCFIGDLTFFVSLDRKQRRDIE